MPECIKVQLLTLTLYCVASLWVFGVAEVYGKFSGLPELLGMSSVLDKHTHIAKALVMHLD